MINKVLQLDEMREALFSVMREAGGIVERYFSLRDVSVRMKSEREVVTEADVAVDRFLHERLFELYPFVEFLTEETAPEDFSSLRDASYLWVIDPIDGTTNFSKKYRHFGISVALVKKGKPVLGVVYDPLQKCFYWAQEDREGAYRDDVAVRVSEVRELKEAVLLCDWPYSLDGRKEIVKFLGVVSQKARYIKMQGSAVLDIAGVAEGSADGYFHIGLKPWDVAAVSLLVEKAGGKVTGLDGGAWDIFRKGILVSNGRLHEELVGMLQNDY